MDMAANGEWLFGWKQWDKPRRSPDAMRGIDVIHANELDHKIAVLRRQLGLVGMEAPNGNS
eukprot:12892513-Prorocentrum_lima.AAC.1